jgi:hypothetical protein
MVSSIRKARVSPSRERNCVTMRTFSRREPLGADTSTCSYRPSRDPYDTLQVIEGYLAQRAWQSAR